MRGVGGALGVASFLLDVFSTDPHSSRMLLTAGNHLNTLYYDTDSDQYYEISDRKEVKDDDGNVIGREATYTVYSDYYYDEDAGRYMGTGESKTYKSTKVGSIEEAYEVLGIH